MWNKKNKTQKTPKQTVLLRVNGPLLLVIVQPITSFMNLFNFWVKSTNYITINELFYISENPHENHAFTVT
jgi:hypothetical protein